ncbi:hypothetical protein ABID77_003135 [Variovorax sp. PvP013]
MQAPCPVRSGLASVLFGAPRVTNMPTSLHLVLVDLSLVPSAGLAGSAGAFPAVRRAVEEVGGRRVTVHAGAQAFLRTLPGRAGDVPASDGTGAIGAADVRVLLHAPSDIDGVLDLLRRVAVADPVPGGMPWPVAVVGPPLDAAAHEALVEAGAQAWADVGAIDAPALRALTDRAGARWRRERALRSELVQLRTRMDERKWVDKAKGLLMLARGMGEDEAFALLRSTAMHANLRLGEVSRAVVDAAQWAEAVNRAGQLRMLSQRLARLAAQVMVNVETARSLDQRRSVAERIDENIAHLARLPPEPACAAALARVRAAWEALVAVWPPRTAPRDMVRIDAAAEALLEGAEVLAEALQTASGRRALRIVNLCGRQRMLAERIAKGALLATFRTGSDAALLPATALAFEDALVELEQAPLTSPEVRAALAAARDEWLRLARSLQGLGKSQGGAALARSAEALVDTFDQLAAQYERSLQVILS